jgi:histidine triad (HIT) family protein
MTACIFCDILAGSQPVSLVYQGEGCTAFMDIRPVNPGHVLVIPNRHAASLAELDPEDGEHIFRVGQRVAAALHQSGLPCDGVNFFLADGKVAGQEVFHVHLHVFPRYQGDGFGLKFNPRYFIPPSRAELEENAKNIKAKL